MTVQSGLCQTWSKPNCWFSHAQDQLCCIFSYVCLFQLLHILNVQRGWEHEGKLATFDSSCAIFVCNWWDQVTAKNKESPNEETNVWNYTVETLQKFDVKEDQIFKMSTTEVMCLLCLFNIVYFYFSK